MVPAMLIVCLFLMGNTKGRENLPPLSLSEATRRCPLPVDPRRAGRDDPLADSNERREARRQRTAGGRLVAASARLDSDGRRRGLGPAPPRESWRDEKGEKRVGYEE